MTFDRKNNKEITNTSIRQKIMKKALICLALLMSACIGSKAQYQKGDLFLYPRVGFALANVSQQELYYVIGNESHKSKMKNGLTAGIEAEVFANNFLSVSAGLFYANQGLRYADWAQENKAERTYSILEDIYTTMHYINLPILLNGYLTEGLAIKAGLQLGYLVKARDYIHEKWGNIEEGNLYVDKGETVFDEDVTSNFNRMDLSIPIGISYEYNHIVLDLRYNLGLTKVYKNTPDKQGRHQVLTFTLGYQLGL